MARSTTCSRAAARTTRQIYQRGSRALPRRQGADRRRQRATGYFATKDYSYRSKQAAGDGWVLVGDAFGFLDPLYSSGVLLALKSGELAADADRRGAGQGRHVGGAAGQVGSRCSIKGMDRMRRLVCEYYDGFSFGQIRQAAIPHFKGIVTDLLIGDLFNDEVDEVVEPMNKVRAELNAAKK